MATPLQQELAGLAKQITTLTMIVALFCMGFGVFIGGQGFAEMFQAAIGIAAAAIFLCLCLTETQATLWNMRAASQ